MTLLPYVKCSQLGHVSGCNSTLDRAISAYVSKYAGSIAHEIMVSNEQRSLEEIAADNIDNETYRSIVNNLTEGSYRVSCHSVYTHLYDNTYCVSFMLTVGSARSSVDYDRFNIAVFIPTDIKYSSGYMSWAASQVDHDTARATWAIDRCIEGAYDYLMDFYQVPLCTKATILPDISEHIVSALSASKSMREENWPASPVCI
tara:strand:- start:1556 stop:2161 length:606 start_codon:yes stop_codon:yes gene_type:complete